MKLEQQVVSLELAKKLKELGVKQESYFYWNTDFPKVVDRTRIVTAPINFGNRYISAFTVAELGEMLPFAIETKGLIWQLDMMKESDGKYYCIYLNKMSGAWLEAFIGQDTEADARAKMMVYLLENNLVSNTQ